jgi:hypothetical protein
MPRVSRCAASVVLQSGLVERHVRSEAHTAASLPINCWSRLRAIAMRGQPPQVLNVQPERDPTAVLLAFGVRRTWRHWQAVHVTG